MQVDVTLQALLLVGLMGEKPTIQMFWLVLALQIKYVHIFLTIFFVRDRSDAFLISHYRCSKKHNSLTLQNYKADVAKSDSPFELHGILSFKEVQRMGKKKNNVQGQVLNKLGPFLRYKFAATYSSLPEAHGKEAVHNLKLAATWQSNTVLYQYS